MNTGKNHLQLDDIQAHLIRSARPSAARYYFLTITNPQEFARFIAAPAFRQLLISDGNLHTEGGTAIASPCFLNIGFTYSGLQRMGLPEHLIRQFPPAFREGMARRAQFIGDQWGDYPTQWEGFYGSPHIHVFLGVNYVPSLEDECARPPQEWSDADRDRHFKIIDDCVASLRQEQPEFPGCHCLAQEQAHVIRYQSLIREHFGFVDGISQPRINDGMPGCAVAGKKESREADWAPLAAGEFLLGYQDELDLKNREPVTSKTDKAAAGDINPLSPVQQDPDKAAFQALTMNGSFLVYRKLEQDVAAFRDYCQDDAELAAKLVGRQQDGTPLTGGHPKPKQNDFDYHDDTQGERCPFTSHVRRVNPRLTLNDGVDEGTSLVDQHRIIRRGMPYGRFIEPGECAASAPAEPRGLHFFCYNARIDSQFEFIQKNWINNCDFMHMPSPIIDPIVGSRGPADLGQFSFNQQRLPVFGLKQYVHVKGGEYFFTPGRKALGLIAGLAQPINPFQIPKQHIDTFQPESSDPLDVARYVDATALLSGKRFVKLKLDAGGAERFYYYFAHPEDVMSILKQTALFTNDHYARKIRNLTGGTMLLSRPNTAERVELKAQSAQQIEHQGFQQQLKTLLQAPLQEIRNAFLQTGQLELVEGLARQLPLQVIKGFYGVAAPEAVAKRILSKTQIAHFFDRADFAELPPVWQTKYDELGFSTTPDQTLLFWVRMLFIEVFLNLYNADYLTELAKNASGELIEHLDAQVRQRIEAAEDDGTLMSRFIQLFQQHYGDSGDALVKAVRQSVLELMVGSTDTTAKGISMVVKSLLEMGNDLVSGLQFLAASQPGVSDAAKPAVMAQVKQALEAWRMADESTRAAMEPGLDPMLDQAIVTCLRLNPVAPVLPRYCTNGATYTSSAGEVLNIEPGSVVLLVSQVTMGANLKHQVSPQQEPFIFMDGTPHACMGHHVAMLEIREALKMLLTLPNVRPAAGNLGDMTFKYNMPASMLLRCDRAD
ncbi:Dyp-type peroxidase domain-containing protein [Ketobacter sp.]|uniref:Dyp-type peroxidase domain-containing protein n=1 Tax=Ketobacter sp. TaxID=2083498 RepID=UPI0025BF2DBB|nr:Dyp-type peroxidase domain-containing protein [Ketobacter sp.]